MAAAENAGKGLTVRRRPDVATWLGLLVAMGGIMAGFFIEEGKPAYLMGPSAALIVVGGCLGATLVANPVATVLDAARRLGDIFMDAPADLSELIETLIQFAVRARKQGIVSLEDDVNEIGEPFLKKAMTLAVDGADLQEIRSMLELEIDVHEREAGHAAPYWA